MDPQGESSTEDDATENYLFLCNGCDRFYVLSVGKDEKKQECPKTQKHSYMRVPPPQELAKYDTCVRFGCSQYLSSAAARNKSDRCEGVISGKNCNSELVTLAVEESTDDEGGTELVSIAEDLEPDRLFEDEQDKTLPREVRILKALIKGANKFISGSGTHHRSKAGAHTATASETHSAAARNKKKVRDSKVESLQDAINAVKEKYGEKTYAAIIKQGEDASRAILNK